MNDVSRETAQLLDQYAALIRKWNPRINLVAPSTLTDLETRHIQDCAQLADLSPADRGHWVDLGSGGGLPAIVLAVCKRMTDLRFSLVESDRRKAEFLRTAARELGLNNVQIIPDRAESLEPLGADFVSARALAPLPRLMPYLNQHLKTTGTAWLMKGARWRDEIEEARQNWAFTYKAHPSQTAENAAILEVSGISHD